MINPMDLTDKHILISGASSGIGKETAIHLSQLGAKITMIARNEQKLQKVKANLEGDGHSYYSFDLNTLDEIEALVKKMVLEQGKFDGFVHSAGIGTARPLSLTTSKFVDEIMRINFYSFIELTRIITKKKNCSDNASVVAVSSISSIMGDKAKTIYSASKGAIDSAVKSMAHELSERKIRINSVLPGYINTEMTHEYYESVGEAAFEQDVLAKQYLGLGEPIDVANTIAFLLSDAAKLITGTNLYVDGGYLS